MNADRRKQVTRILHRLAGAGTRAADLQAEVDEIKTDLEAILDNERDAFDNLPDSLQTDERQTIVDDLELAVSALDEIVATIDPSALDDTATTLEGVLA